MMPDTNYNVEALVYLLNKDCVSERYYPLILIKNELIEKSRALGCKTKNDIAQLPDSGFILLGIQDEATIRLLRRFLSLYDPDPRKFREIEKSELSTEEKNAFRELYYLPGVKYTRASLYYYSGYRSLKAISDAQPEEILAKTASAISCNNLYCIVPMPKEVRTHIAVSKAFTQKMEE